jgi:hypothetical protein
MPTLTEWGNFYVIVGSAAGALIGLQFVVITLIAGRPVARDEAQAGDAFSTPSVVHFGVVLLLSAVACAPWGGVGAVSVLWGLVGFGGAVYVVVVARRLRAQTAYRPVFEDWLFHALLPFAAYALLAGAAFAARDNTRAALFTATAGSAGIPARQSVRTARLAVPRDGSTLRFNVPRHSRFRAHGGQGCPRSRQGRGYGTKAGARLSRGCSCQRRAPSALSHPQTGTPPPPGGTTLPPGKLTLPAGRTFLPRRTASARRAKPPARRQKRSARGQKRSAGGRSASAGAERLRRPAGRLCRRGAGGQTPATGGRPTATGGRAPATGGRAPAPDGRPPAPDGRPPAMHSRPTATGGRPTATGGRPTAT